MNIKNLYLALPPTFSNISSLWCVFCIVAFWKSVEKAHKYLFGRNDFRRKYNHSAGANPLFFLIFSCVCDFCCLPPDIAGQVYPSPSYPFLKHPKKLPCWGVDPDTRSTARNKKKRSKRESKKRGPKSSTKFESVNDQVEENNKTINANIVFYLHALFLV